MRYLDPLYGQLSFSDKEFLLFQTRALTRLRDVSLSAVPPFTWASGMIASRFEHSVGVAFLAKKLGLKPQFKPIKDNLYLAALLHDAGSPPFSHIAEDFQQQITNMNHEEFIEEILAEKKLQQKIKLNNGDFKTIILLIKGQLSPWSDLINGSIDLDNLDNSLRWGLGAGVFKNKFYEPEEIINAFVLKQNKLALDIEYKSNIQKWELARRLVYDLVYSDANLSPGSMIARALELAYQADELDKNYFFLTDSQAFYLLENRFNSASQKLAQAARFWNFYVLAAKQQTSQQSKKFKDICLNWKKRFKLANDIAKNINPPF